jgi:hypothetical protein
MTANDFRTKLAGAEVSDHSPRLDVGIVRRANVGPDLENAAALPGDLPPANVGAENLCCELQQPAERLHRRRLGSQRNSPMTTRPVAAIFSEAVPSAEAGSRAATAVLENVARRLTESNAGRGFSDAEWKRQRTRLLELVSILREWDQRAPRANSGVGKVEVLCQREH